MGTDFAIGGTVGGITKTLTAPIERVKLLIQTQDANPKIISGEVERYKGMGDCFRRVTAEQGFPAFWRGNGANVMRYFPQQAFNLSFKDTLKRMFPKYDPKTQFWGFFGVNLASAGLGAALSLCICYPLDFAICRYGPPPLPENQGWYGYLINLRLDQMLPLRTPTPAFLSTV